MASNSEAPVQNPAPPPGALPNGHFANGESGQGMSQPLPPPPGAGPPPPHHAGYPPYGGYTGPPMGAPQKPMMPPNQGSGGYPPPPGNRFPSGQSISQQSGPTPTLNSLLQGRNQRMPQGPSQSPPGPYGPPPPNTGGYPQPWPNDPNYGAYRPHPGHRPPYGPGPPQPGPYPPHQYHGMPPQPPGPNYPYPHGRYPPPPTSQPSNISPTSTTVSATNSATSSPLTTLASGEGPPPHPGQHEGKPSTTWTPPIQSEDSSNPSQASQEQPAPNAQIPSQQPSSYEPTGGPISRTEDEGGGQDPQRVTPDLRPTPSPTGSSSSRSMSPAVGQQGGSQIPPRPPSNHSDHGGSPNSGPSNRMTPQAGYQQPPMGPPSQMMYNVKGGSGPPPASTAPPPPGQPGQQHQMPPYGGHPAQNYGHYGPRPPYGPAPAGYPGSYIRPNNIPSGYQGYPGGQQYPGAWNNSTGPPPPQQQQQPPGAMPSSGKGAPPPGAPGTPVAQRHPGPPGPGQYPPRPSHQPMMKGYPPQPGGVPQSNSYNGPPMYNGPNNSAPPMYNGPGMPPPHNSVPGMGIPPHQASGYPGSYSNAHPMNSYGSSSPMPPGASPGGMSPASAPPNGPDGLPIHDETSQQSTLSQSSDSRSEGRQTPKTVPNYMGGGPPTAPGYPPSQSAGPQGSPHSSAPSPGGSMGSSAGGHDGGYPRDMASPNWQRTTASPGSNQHQMFGTFNSIDGVSGGGIPPLSTSPGVPATYTPPTPQTVPTTGRVTKVSKNSETLMRLYEMDENPDRRMFLDRLLSFMEDRGTPIVQCPTISKNPLDLYKLYIYTKERGGYLECTRSKTWKDIAAQLGIGASSSGAYTLKKHYGKNLLAYECQFDRGGMDPAPILAQVEAQTKKKSKGSAPSMPQPPPVPSPGSQDSRDSYSNSSDPYFGYPQPGGPPHNSYPPPNSASTPPNSDRPPSHPGMMPSRESIRIGNPFDEGTYGFAGSGYPPAAGYNYPPGPPPPGGYPPSYPPTSSGGPRPSWPPHSGYMGGTPPPPGASGPPPPSSANDAYGRPGWPQPQPGYGPRPPYPGQAGPPSTATGPPSQSQPYGGQPPYQDQYQGYGSAASPGSTPPTSYPGGAPSKPPGPPGPPTTQASRPTMPPNSYPYQGPRPPMYQGSQPQWQNRYPGPGYPQGDRNWPPNSASNAAPRGPGPQWNNERPGYYGGSNVPGPWPTSGGMVGKAPIRPPFRPDMRGQPPSGPQRPGYPGTRGREMAFPPGSVEATPPLMLKRRRHNKVDVQPVEGWRLVMALKSGLLMESTWALDVINVLLFDDNGIAYFGLGNMPGLLDALLEQWRASLIAMFGINEDLEIHSEKEGEERSRKRTRTLEASKQLKWFHSTKSVESKESDLPDLGKAPKVDSLDKCVVLTHSDEHNFTKRPRFLDEDVSIDEREDEIFVTDYERDWDTCEGGFESGLSHWMNGGGNTTEHVVTHFATDLGRLPFVRMLKEKTSELQDKIEKTEVVSIKKEPLADVEPKEGAVIKAEEDEQDEDIVDKIKRLTGIALRDPEQARRRWKELSLEDENHVRDEPSLQLISEAEDNLGRRAVCISTILRNLSFVPGNEYDLSRNPNLLIMLGRLLLFKHWYPPRPPKQRNYDRGEEEENAESCTSLTGDDEWWWEYLHVIRENVMIILTNITGAMDLEPFEEGISRPILDGLLEWAISPSAYAQDPFPYVGPSSPVSPQRCAIEALCKLCLLESNVDLIVTTPPFWRLKKLIKLLAKKLYRYEDQVLREFSINLLYYLSAADSGIARTIALSDTTVGLLLSFIEQAEQNALVIAQQHGVNALRDNPESMGTSLDMMRRAANTLNNLSQHKDNLPLLARHEQRLLTLVMSQILDQGVASILSHVLFNIGANTIPAPLPPSLPDTPPSKSETSEVKMT